MYILSYDVASKSLGLSIIKFNENWKSDLMNIKTSFDSIDKNISSVKLCQIALDHINMINKLLDNLIQPLVLDVVDLIPGKKIKETDVILRANRLRGYLNYVDDTYLNTIEDELNSCKVLVEYQMGPNNKSNSVCSQILYHYADNDSGFKNINTSVKETNIFENKTKYTTEIIGPSLKNKINLDREKPRQYFISKYAKTYNANKAHSVANMIHWLKTKNAVHMLKNIKKKNLDDIADSITMSLAWIFIKSGYL